MVSFPIFSYFSMYFILFTHIGVLSTQKNYIRIDYLIPTYNIRVLLLHSNLMKKSSVIDIIRFIEKLSGLLFGPSCIKTDFVGQWLQRRPINLKKAIEHRAVSRY